MLGLGTTPIHRHPVNPSRRTAKPGESPHCPDTYQDLDDYPDDRYPDKSCRERRQAAPPMLANAPIAPVAIPSLSLPVERQTTK